MAKTLEVPAYDRDGVVLFAPTYKDGHPSRVSYKNIRDRIDPVVAKTINENGGIVLSNQDGASKYKSSLELRWEFEKIIEQLPGIRLCLWSLPGINGHYGDRCEGLLVRRVGYPPTNVSQSCRRYGNFRKPNIGMFRLAKHLGFDFQCYIGDLSGLPRWADGKDSDLLAAKNAAVKYYDVKQAFPASRSRSGT